MILDLASESPSLSATMTCWCMEGLRSSTRNSLYSESLIVYILLNLHGIHVILSEAFKDKLENCVTLLLKVLKKKKKVLQDAFPKNRDVFLHKHSII